MSTTLTLALGRKPFALTLPAGVECKAHETVLDAEAPPKYGERTRFKEALEQPAEGPSLTRHIADKRHVVVLVGDVSCPAPYASILPDLKAFLVEAGIRPSRISFLCCPGPCDPVLGYSAIRRYGEEIAGEHELRAWCKVSGIPAESDPLHEDADLKIAVFPDFPGVEAMLPNTAKPDFVILFSCGQERQQRIQNIRAGSSAIFRARSDAPATRASEAPVRLVTGGGDPTDATLEEALASLRMSNLFKTQKETEAQGERTTVMAFWGGDGLGSACFTLDLWAKLEDLEERLKANPTVGAMNKKPAEPYWCPAGEIISAISSGKLILFSPGLHKHQDGDAIDDRLAALPAISQRFKMAAEEGALWECLQAWHGKACTVWAEPLGWRAFCG